MPQTVVKISSEEIAEVRAGFEQDQAIRARHRMLRQAFMSDRQARMPAEIYERMAELKRRKRFGEAKQVVHQWKTGEAEKRAARAISAEIQRQVSSAIKRMMKRRISEVVSGLSVPLSKIVHQGMAEAVIYYHDQPAQTETAPPAELAAAV